jgi:hypothetical protein
MYLTGVTVLDCTSLECFFREAKSLLNACCHFWTLFINVFFSTLVSLSLKKKQNWRLLLIVRVSAVCGFNNPCRVSVVLWGSVSYGGSSPRTLIDQVRGKRTTTNCYRQQSVISTTDSDMFSSPLEMEGLVTGHGCQSDHVCYVKNIVGNCPTFMS